MGVKGITHAKKAVEPFTTLWKCCTYNVKTTVVQFSYTGLPSWHLPDCIPLHLGQCSGDLSTQWQKKKKKRTDHVSNTVSNKSNAILMEILLAQCQELRIFHNKINLQVRKEFCRLFLDPNFFLLVYWLKWLSEYSISFIPFVSPSETSVKNHATILKISYSFSVLTISYRVILARNKTIHSFANEIAHVSKMSWVIQATSW